MALIRVFTIPLPDGQYVFGGKPKVFHEVDWFRDDPMPGLIRPTMATEGRRKQIAEFIKKKNYYSDKQAFLVLCSTASFTINYDVG